MKTTKFTYWLVLALAMTFAATGCKTRKPDITPIPGRTATPAPPGPASLPDAGRIKPDIGPGAGPTSETWSPDDPNLVADRVTLAMHIVHFDFDSATVKASEKPHVEAVAAMLRSDAQAKLLIEGHCDERGTEEYNRSLGERRALSLREDLANLGIDPNRIRTVSFGEDRPFSQGHDETAWKQNRRGEFVLYHPK